MGLWLKQDDGTLVSVGGMGMDDYVITGDPHNPPANWADQQLLYSDEHGLWMKRDGEIIQIAGHDGTDGIDGTIGADGKGWTKGSYSHEDGTVTFESNDGLGFQTLDLRGADGGGEILTGDPQNPPADWVPGQLLYDGWEDTGDGSEPHDHDYLPLSGGTLTGDLQVDGVVTFGKPANGKALLQLWDDGVGNLYAVGVDTNRISMQAGGTERLSVNHDPHFTSSDAGGYVRAHGDLKVDGTVTTGPGKAVKFGGNWDGAYITNTSASGREYMNFGVPANGGSKLSLYGPGDPSYPGNATIFTGGTITALFDEDQNTRLYGDLQADGNITTGAGKKVNFGGNWDGGRVYNSASAGREFLKIGESADSGAQVMLYGNGDRIGNDHSSTETPYPGGATIFTGGSLTALFHNNNNTKLYGDLQVNGIINGTLAFNVDVGIVRAQADGITVADVLERAETATMPVVEVEGVGTTDIEVESVTVNEVVTALLAKVKQLSAEIEELKGA